MEYQEYGILLQWEYAIVTDRNMGFKRIELPHSFLNSYILLHCMKIPQFTSPVPE